MADPVGQNGDICLATLRGTDRDRYLACLLSPPDKRGALAALYAFNAEIARIRDVVREPLPGEIRLQWWRDLLEGSARGDSTGNPVAAGLLEAIETYRLPRQTLVDMIEARIFDLYDDPLTDRNALEGYAGETASALIQARVPRSLRRRRRKIHRGGGARGRRSGDRRVPAADADPSPPSPALPAARYSLGDRARS